MDLVGNLFENKYQILENIGKGGMSNVYLARDVKINKLWAIKEIDKKDSKLRNQLLLEAEILKRLDHPALPRIVDIIDNELGFFIVMDYIDGNSLDRILEEDGPIQEETLIHWAKQVCEVLDYLHNQKPNPVIHRDMKPGNLMLSSIGKIKLIDFGIAREHKEDVTTDTTHIGTRGYAAPEQYGSHQTDARTDIYSLGVTLYHLATGKGPNDPPFELKPIRELKAYLSEGLEYIIGKCTQQDPSLRYQTAAQLLHDLVNINKLNSQYKNLVRKKIIKVSTVLLSFLISLFVTVTGVTGVAKEKNEEYKYYIEQALSLKRNNEINKAIDKFGEAIGKDPSNSEGYLQIAKTYINDLSDLQRGISYLEEQVVLKKVPAAKSDDMVYNLAVAYFQSGMYDKAYKHFNTIKSKKIPELEYYKTISNALGSNASDSKDIKLAVEQLEQYIDNNGAYNTKVNDYIILSTIYLNNYEIFSDGQDKVIAILEKALSQLDDKNDITLLQKLGQAHYTKAILIKSPGNDAYKQEFTKALEYYNKITELDFKSPDIFNKKGLILKYLERFQESEKVFMDMINYYPNDFKGYTELALLYIEVEAKKTVSERNYDNVKKYYEAAMRNAGNSTNIDFKRLEKILKDLKVIS